MVPMTLNEILLIKISLFKRALDDVLSSLATFEPNTTTLFLAKLSFSVKVLPESSSYPRIEKKSGVLPTICRLAFSLLNLTCFEPRISGAICQGISPSFERAMASLISNGTLLVFVAPCLEELG